MALVCKVATAVVVVVTLARTPETKLRARVQPSTGPQTPQGRPKHASVKQDTTTDRSVEKPELIFRKRGSRRGTYRPEQSGAQAVCSVANSSEQGHDKNHSMHTLASCSGRGPASSLFSPGRLGSGSCSAHGLHMRTEAAAQSSAELYRPNPVPKALRKEERSVHPIYVYIARMIDLVRLQSLGGVWEWMISPKPFGVWCSTAGPWNELYRAHRHGGYCDSILHVDDMTCTA